MNIALYKVIHDHVKETVTLLFIIIYSRNKESLIRNVNDKDS